MGMKHRFRLSDMIPNAWFYKLKDMSKSSNHNHLKKRPPPPSSSSTVAAAAATRAPRYSCYFSGRAANHHHHHHHKLYNSPVNQKATDTHFPDPPRRSSSSSRRRKAIYKPSPKLLSPPPPSSSSVCSKCRDCNDDAKSTLDYSTSPFESSPDFCPSFLTSDDEEEDEEFAPASFEDQVASAAWSASARSCHSCKVSSSSADIIIDVNGQNSSCGRNIKKLPPIVTKPSKMDHVKAQRTKSRPSTTPRKSTSKRNHSATGIRLKANSPRRLAGRKLQGGNRKSPVTTCLSAAGKRIGESFAVVKSSVDPERDFMESMVEMIVENGIRSSRQLEDLLACYLSLNSTKYHEAIVRAFEQIWFHMS